MNAKALGAVVAVLCTAGCPSSTLLTEISGRGGSGAPASDRLVFVQQPSNAARNTVITPPIQVQALDSLGRPDSTFAKAVTIALLPNSFGGTLSGGTSVVPFNSVALFGDLMVTAPGTGYTLQASASGATATTSSAFNIQ